VLEKEVARRTPKFPLEGKQGVNPLETEKLKAQERFHKECAGVDFLKSKISGRVA
jgi:hypothetical protein